jgi:hypothetical protein
MTSMLAPEAVGTNYRRMLVMAPVNDLALRQRAESAFVRAAVVRDTALICDPVCRRPLNSESPTEFVAGHTLLFPGRQYSSSEIATMLRENRIDATLALFPTSAGVDQSFVPPSLETSCAEWNAVTYCGAPVGGVTVAQPWATFAARVYDARDGRTVWIATGTTGESFFDRLDTLLESVARRTVDRLRADGAIR